MPHLTRHQVHFGLSVLLLLAVLALAACSDGSAEADTASGPAYLVVGDASEARISVYSIPDHELLAEIDGIVPNDHTGFLPLEDGRLLFIDDLAEELVVLEVSESPQVVARVPAGHGIHLAVDPDGLYAAITTADVDPETWALTNAMMTLVDLDSYEATQFPLETGEPGVMVVSNPLRVMHRNDAPAQLEVYPVDRILAGDFAFTADLPIGQLGHGEAVSDSRNRVYVATDDGLEVIDVTEDGLDFVTAAPWDTSELEGGRAFYVRVSSNGDQIVSYLANRETDQPWGEWQNDAYILDLDTNEPLRIPLANGYVWRMGIGEGYAAYFNLTPAGDPDGDRVHLLDIDPASDTYGEIVARIPLPELSNRATPDDAIWMQPDAEYRRITMSPDGQFAYVTNGGDGFISVIDIEAAEVIGRIDTSGSLAGGGALTVVQPGRSLVDTLAR